MKMLAKVSALALAAALSACGGEDLTGSPVVVAPPPPPPPPTGTSFSVEACLTQTLRGDQGDRRVIDIMIPDAVVYDVTRPASWPNGRQLDDQVVDRMLSGLFLSQSRHTIHTLENIPLNPRRPAGENYRTVFPYYGPALSHPTLGPPRLSDTNGTNFNFRTEDVSQFVKVERVASPAVSTVNVLGPRKVPYNEGNPVQDVNLAFRADIAEGLAFLTGQIADDLQALGLTICATP